MKTTASPRIVAAIALLDARADERLLEIGCGTGQGIQCLLERCPTASVVAIDRSDAAVVRARVVNAAAIDAGHVRISAGDIESGPVAPGGFDRAFAIRVNSFWTHPGIALPHVAASVRPGGELWIIHDGPEDKIVAPTLQSLRRAKLRAVRTQSAARAFAIVARFP